MSRTDKLIAVLLIVPGIIHLLPLSGLLGAARLTALYGMPFESPSLLVLMQHRAVLFGLMGTFLILAAWRKDLQRLAIAAGLISAVSFIVLALLADGANPAIQKVIIADVVAVLCLIGAGVVRQCRRNSARSHHSRGK